MEVMCSSSEKEKESKFLIKKGEGNRIDICDKIPGG